ncbi:MAG: uncharacterized protein KVP18_001200 [Porospora cf. gigantea A]|uniref:uncharacterized protein n=1 Tax=Porospora cf. gigantea A TaxID=2853593 RepID=UPI00355A7FAB|nr:MAG: hypothetical protein KVP18_001200 [Porospora cf. gigantea A]
MSALTKPNEVKKVRVVSPVRSPRSDDQPPYEPPRPPTPFRSGAAPDSPLAVYAASLKPIQTLKKKKRLRPGTRFKFNKIVQKKKFRQVAHAESEPLQPHTVLQRRHHGSRTNDSVVEAELPPVSQVVPATAEGERIDPTKPLSRRRFCDISPYEEGADKRRRRKRRRIESAETASSEGPRQVRHWGQSYLVVEVLEACGAATN